jgi:hypothetical protein
MSLSVVLLIVFVACGFVYGQASKDLQRLDKLRITTEPPPLPDNILGAATDFARKMGITLAPGGAELKSFCDRHGHGETYTRANRRLYGAIIVALACAYFIIRLGPGKSFVP